MYYFGIALVILGVFAMASVQIVQKHVMKEGFCSKQEVLVGQFAFAAPFLALAWLLLPEFGLTGSAHWSVFWFAVACTTLANIVIQYANVESRAIADISLVAPFQGMTPLLITVTALTIGEWPTKLGVAGIVLVAIGTYIHGREKATTLREYLQPLTMFKLPANFAALGKQEQVQARKDTRAIRFAYLSACFGTLGLLFDGVTARNGSVALGFTVEAIALACAFTLIPPEKNAVNQAARSVKVFWLSCLGGLWTLHIVLIMTAFRFAPIAYVGSLKRFSIIAAVVLAWVVLKETKARRRLLPAGIITAGGMLLVFDPGASSVITSADAILKIWLP